MFKGHSKSRRSVSFSKPWPLSRPKAGMSKASESFSSESKLLSCSKGNELSTGAPPTASVHDDGVNDTISCDEVTVDLDPPDGDVVGVRAIAHTETAAPQPASQAPAAGSTLTLDEKFVLLSAYLDDEVTEAERYLVEHWLASDPKMRDHFQKQLKLRQGLRSLWKSDEF